MAEVRAATETDCDTIYRIQMAAIRALPPGAQGKDGIERWLAGQEPSVYARSMAEELFIVAEIDGAPLILTQAPPKAETTFIPQRWAQMIFSKPVLLVQPV